MLRSIRLLIVVLMSLALTGCGGTSAEWLVTAENQSDVPCSFFITLGSNAKTETNVENVEKGKTLPLIAGDTKTVVQSVKVVRGDKEETLTPKTELPIGKRFAIIVKADGKVETSVTDR